MEFVKELIPKGLKESQIIVLMKHGSHLYGTDTPDSDTDYKGIYIPTKRQILLQQVPKSYSIHPEKKGEGVRNTKDDLDVEIYSLHYFLELAMKGETIAIDMLHAPLSWPVRTSMIWWFINEHRHLFHTQNLKALVGYARKQAAKYGIKGSRLNAAKSVIDFLSNEDPEEKLWCLWDFLPEGEHIHKITPEGFDPERGHQLIRTYQVCGKQIQSTVKVGYALDIVKRFYDEYGHRAKLAAENKGIDWKAVSHALRAAYQVGSILEEGDITFPLPCASFLKAVKVGDYGWKFVQDTLEYKMEVIEELAEKSELPDKVDRHFWEKWLMEVLEAYVE